MKSYDPELATLRQLLALEIMDKLDDCGFTRVIKNPRSGFAHNADLAEFVYERNITEDGRLKVKVFTTIRGGKGSVPLEVRKNGKDAIRVCATYVTKSGQERGLVKERRINRTGDIADIVNRMYERMRSVWKSAKTGDKCHNCGAPKFVAKSGKEVCAEICWKSDEEKQADKIAFKTRNRRYRRRWV